MRCVKTAELLRPGVSRPPADGLVEVNAAAEPLPS